MVDGQKSAPRPGVMDMDELANRFSYHPARSQERQEAHGGVRNACLGLAHTLVSYGVEGRELSLAITSLEQVMFWANAGLARQPDTGVSGNAHVVTAKQKGQHAYAAYSRATGGVTFDGRDMPAWDALGERIQNAWIAAATQGGVGQ